MKKLLLLVFSASLFASAQTVNVVEYSATASGTFTQVYIGESGDNAGLTVSTTTVITFHDNGSVTVGDDNFVPIGDDIRLSEAFFSTDITGDYLTNLAAYPGGFWYRDRVRVNSPVIVNQFAPFMDAIGWSQSPGNSNSYFRRSTCESTGGTTIFASWNSGSNERAGSFTMIDGSVNPRTITTGLTAQEIIDRANIAYGEATHPELCDAIGNAETYGWTPDSDDENAYSVHCSSSFFITWIPNREVFNVVRLNPFEQATFTRTADVRNYIQDQSALCDLASSGEWNEPTGDVNKLARSECDGNRFYVAEQVGEIIEIRYGSSVASATMLLVHDEEIEDHVVAGDAVRNHSCNTPN